MGIKTDKFLQSFGIDYSNDAMVHHRTEGSKNGVRLYQYPDGRYTPLGIIHYHIGKRKNNLYYDPSYKPSAFDPYGRYKQQELQNRVNDNGGKKNYKGYERAEFQNNDAYNDPKIAPYSNQIQTDKKLKKRRAQGYTMIDDEQEQRYREYLEEEYDRIKNNVDQASINNKNVYEVIANPDTIKSGKDFLTYISQEGSLPGILIRSIKWLVDNHKNKQESHAQVADQPAIKDTHASSAEAWVHIGKKRLKDSAVYMKGYLNSYKNKKKKSASLGLGKMYWKSHLNSIKSNKNELEK